MLRHSPFFVALALLVALWYGVTAAGQVPAYLLPGPGQVWAYFSSNMEGLLKDLAISILQAVLGLLLAVLISSLVAVVFYYSKLLEQSLMPFFVILQTVPLVVISPLLTIWVGNGLESKVIMAFVISLFPLVVSTMAGIASVSRDNLEMMVIYTASRFQILIKLVIPQALPRFFQGLRISVVLALIGSLVGEFSGSNRGIGFRILVSSYQTNTAAMICGVIMVAISGCLLYWIVSVIQRKVITWEA